MLTLNGRSLTIEDVVRVARNGEEVRVDESALKAVEENRRVVERILEEGRTVYGVNTGLGDLVRVTIPPEDVVRLQENLIRSHVAGTGDPIPEEVVRGAMLIRANSLLNARSGVRPAVINTLIEMLNRGIIPWVPEHGSVGASGDLAPLAHVALVMMGEGRAWYRGELMDGGEALKRAGIRPVRFLAREGLAMLNGTSFMASYLSLAVHDATRLLENAVVAAALSAEALCATDAAFDPRISEVRAHPGQRRVAAALLSLLEGSERVKRGRREKVQDAYSIRCTPQVLGPVLETLEFVRGIVEREINSVTDNPLIFDTAISGGNFHGEYLALAADYLAIAVSEVASISERRIYRLLTSHLSGLPPFLTREPGLNSGYMIAQYTAASLVAENKVLAHPASVDSLPTSAGQEDHVSMGGVAARKVRRVVENAETVVAIEMLLAAQGIDLSEGALGKGTEGAYREIRKTVPMLERDREVHVDIEKILRLVREGAVVRASGLTGL